MKAGVERGRNRETLVLHGLACLAGALIVGSFAIAPWFQPISTLDLCPPAPDSGLDILRVQLRALQSARPLPFVAASVFHPHGFEASTATNLTALVIAFLCLGAVGAATGLLVSWVRPRLALAGALLSLSCSSGLLLRAELVRHSIYHLPTPPSEKEFALASGFSLLPLSLLMIGGTVALVREHGINRSIHVFVLLCAATLVIQSGQPFGERFEYDGATTERAAWGLRLAVTLGCSACAAMACSMRSRSRSMRRDCRSDNMPDYEVSSGASSG